MRGSQSVVLTTRSLLGALQSAIALTFAQLVATQANFYAEPSRESLEHVDSSVAVADSAWQTQRYDLAAERFRQIWKALPPSDKRDRAGVMAARALLEIGRRDEATELLEAVAGGQSHGYWWGTSLYHLARLAPPFTHGKGGQEDSLRLAGEMSKATSRLRQSVSHFAGRAEQDSTWQKALIDAHIELLDRLSIVGELDKQLERAIDDAVTKEQQAAVRMAYVAGLSRIRPRQFLPELRRQANDEIRERIRRTLDYVINNLEETSPAPAAYEALARQYSGMKPDRQFEVLEKLASRFPDTAEGVRARSTLARASASVTISTTQQAWSSTVSVPIRLSIRHAEEVDVQVLRLNYEEALEWWARSEVRQSDPPHHAVEVELLRISASKWSNIDTTLALRLPAGFYICRAQAGSRPAQMTFRVTDHQLLHHVRDDSIFVHVASNLALPVPEAQVEAYKVTPVDPRDRSAFEVVPLGSWKTGKDGKTVIPLRTGAAGEIQSPAKLLLASRVGDHFDLATDYLGADWSNGVVWTDRTVYRPGEKVAFQIVSLHGPSHAMAPTPPDTFRVWVAMPTLGGRHSQARWETTLTSNEFGAASGAFVIPAEAADGEAMVEVNQPYGAHSRSVARAGARIRAFDRPDFDFEVKLRSSEVLLGDSLLVDVLGQTAQGVPLADARVTATATMVEMHRRYRIQDAPLAQGWYGPGDGKAAIYYEHPRSHKGSIGSFAAVLDDSGRAFIRVPGPEPSEKTSIQYRPREIVGVVLDVAIDGGGGRHQSKRLEVPVYPGRAWCTVADDDGLRPFAHVQDPVTVRRIDNANKPSPGLVYFKWVRLRPDLVHDRYIESVVDSGKVETDGSASVHLSPPLQSLEELVLDVWADPAARMLTRIGQPPNLDVPAFDSYLGRFGGESDARHWVVVDRLQYSVGDTAHVVLSPALRSLAGVLWVGEGGSRRRPFAVLPGMGDSVVSIPIQPEHLPDAFVSWSPVYMPQRYNISPQGGVPKDRIVVEPSSRLLSLEISTDRAEYVPGDTVEVRVTASDPAGQPVEALVTVGAVDEAVYSIAPDDFDIARELYRLTWDGPISAAMEAIIPSPPAPPARLAFHATAFWEPALVTDAATGTATLKAVLPDDLARWRITARAVDQKGRVGEARKHFVTDSPLQVRPRLPRFARVGDHFEFGVWVDNRKEGILDCEVSWHSELLEAASETQVSLAPGPGGTAMARFSAVAARAGIDSVSISAHSGELSDSMLLSLPVLSPPSDLDGGNRSREEVRFGLEMILSGVQTAMIDTTRGSYFGQPDDILRLLLALERGYRLLNEHELPAGQLPSPTPWLIERLERSLESHWRTAIDERTSAEYALRQANETARFVGDLERAAKIGWWEDKDGTRHELVDWLSKVVSSPILTGDRRVEVIAELSDMGVEVAAAVEKALESRDSLSPGGRALLARSVRRSQPEEAASLLASAIGFAQVSEDSAYAHFEIRPGLDREWSLVGIRGASEVLQSIAASGARSPLAHALANAIAINRASGAWRPEGDNADAVRALVAYAEALVADRGVDALDHVAVAGPPIFTLTREVSILTRVGNGNGPSRGAPDRLSCTVGDTLRVSLIIRAVAPVSDVLLDDPTPAGCSGAVVSASHDAWRSAVTVRDSYVQVAPGSGGIRPGDTVLTHDLLVERRGSFHVPPARMFLSNQPGLWATSAPLVIESVGRE
jgi:hypothetical protein